MLKYVERLSAVAEVSIFSCQPELIALYSKKGYSEVGRFSLKELIGKSKQNIDDFKTLEIGVITSQECIPLIGMT